MGLSDEEDLFFWDALQGNLRTLAMVPIFPDITKPNAAWPVAFGAAKVLVDAYKALPEKPVGRILMLLPAIGGAPPAAGALASEFLAAVGAAYTAAYAGAVAGCVLEAGVRTVGTAAVKEVQRFSRSLLQMIEIARTGNPRVPVVTARSYWLLKQAAAGRP